MVQAEYMLAEVDGALHERDSLLGVPGAAVVDADDQAQLRLDEGVKVFPRLQLLRRRDPGVAVGWCPC